MLMFSISLVLSLISVVTCTTCSAGSGQRCATVMRNPGSLVTLPSLIDVGPEIAEVEWKRSSPSTMLLRHTQTNTKYFQSIYTGRIELDLRNFNLKISNVQKNDAGDFEFIFKYNNSGTENKNRIRLEVYETVSGANIVVQNITGTCDLNLTCSVLSGDTTSFEWQREGETVGNDSTHQLSGLGETVLVRYTAKAKDILYKCNVGNPLSTITAEIKLQWHACKLHSSVTDETTTPRKTTRSTTETSKGSNIAAQIDPEPRKGNTATLVPQRMSLLVGLAVMVTLLISLSL